MDNDWLEIFITLLVATVLVIGICTVFNQSGDEQAYLACQAEGIPADRDLTYMYGIYTNRAICVTQNEVQLNMEEWKEND